MIDDGALKEKAREAIRTEKLPNRAPSRIWGGNGFWMSCAICGNLVNADELGYELRFSDREGLTTDAEYHVHIRCFAAWDAERRRPLGLVRQHEHLPADPADGTISTSERRPCKRESV